MIVYNNQAPKAVNNVGQFGATEGSIGAYKSAAEYAADAKYWALLSQTKYSTVDELLAEIERLYGQGRLLEEDIKQLKIDFEAQQQDLLGLIQSTNTAIDNTNSATELSKEATQAVLGQLDIISNMTVQTTLLPPGSLATGSYDNLTGEFSFGIPEGKPGRDGTDGTISDIGSVPVGTPVTGDYGFYIDKDDGGLYRANMSDIANLVPSIRSISINGGEEQTGAVSFNSVSSFNNRTGDVVSQTGDYEVGQITGAAASGANSDITSLSGLTSALSVSQGGTGATTPDGSRTNLGLGSVATEDVVPLLKGGTGATTASAARTNLGLGSVSTESIVPIVKGGTGATSAENARLALVAAKSGENSDITSMTNSVTFTQPVSVADAVGPTNAVNLGQINSNQGASTVGTTSGETVQQILDSLAGSFVDGARLRSNSSLILDTSTTPNQLYRWGGALPKIVPAGSTPGTTGGTGLGAWLSVGDALTKAWVTETFQVSTINRVGTFTTGGTATSWKSALLYEANGFYYMPITGTITVPPNSTPDANWRAVGLLRGYPVNDVRNWSTNITPTGTTDIANNTDAIQFMIDTLGAGSTIVFPAGFTTVVNRLDIKYPDMTICGGGVIDGTIRVCRETFATSSDIYMNCTIKDVLFSTSRGLADAIQLAYCRIGSISNIIDFRGYTNAIHVLKNTEVGGSTANAWGQMVNRWIVSNCHYGKDGTSTVGRFIYSEASEGMEYPIADWVVKGNEGHATLDHIVLSTVDGLTVSDNIMFFPGYQASSSTKRSHIRIETGGVWVQIHDNKFFESGGTSLYMSGVTRFNVHDNLYAFGAQRIPTYQIIVTGTPQSGQYFTQGIIHDETIVSPAGGGIYVDSNQGRMKVHSCNIQNPSSSSYYYGTDAQPEAIGVAVALTTLAVEVIDCTVREGVHSFANVSNNLYRDNVLDGISGGTGFSRVSVLKVLNLTSASSAVDAHPWDAIDVSVSSSFGLSTILNSGPTKILTVTNTGTSNFNIVHSATLKLAGSVTAVLTPGSTITLRVATGGNASEVSRAII